MVTKANFKQDSLLKLYVFYLIKIKLKIWYLSWICGPEILDFTYTFQEACLKSVHNRGRGDGS